MKLRAQVTMFMLLGLVIVGTFSFVFYMGKYISNVQLQKRIDTIMNDVIQNTPINLYVTECLDDAITEGLILIAGQGGVIYMDQNGTSLKPWMPCAVGGIGPLYETNSIRVADLIIYIHTTDGDYSPLPIYPCLGGAECYFRANTPTDPEVYGKKRLFLLEGESGTRCVHRPSIKKQLENYISNITKECVDFGAISDFTGYNITEGNVSSNISLGEDDLTIKLNFPIVITVQGHEPVTRIIDFFGNQPVRLRDVYALVDFLVEKDSTNITYNITKEWMEYESHGNVTVGEETIKLQEIYFQKLVEAEIYDIFEIRDALYKVGGKDYTFRFAREDRWPALDYIGKDERPYEWRPGYLFDIRVPVGINVNIPPLGNSLPFGHDPDEDVLVYNYSGWQETCYEWFNESAFLAGRCELDPYVCVVKDCGAQPREWTSSKPCFREGCRVNYTTQLSDIGPHILNVSVFDGKNIDWQEVRIMVFSELIAAADTYNLYPHVNNSEASIEDPYVLDAQGSGGYFCADKIYDWQDPSEITDYPSRLGGGWTITNHTLYSGEQARIVLVNDPCIYACPGADIRNVSWSFENYSGPSGKLEHNITLTVEACAEQQNVTLLVNVSLCLPHRSNAAPYPYQGIIENYIFTDYGGYETNKFLGNHTCCTDDYNYNTGAVCYNFTGYTCKPDYGKEYYPADKTVMNITDETVRPTLGDVDMRVNISPYVALTAMPNYPNWETDLPTVVDSDNDVYRRTLVQECGYRGNACSGPVSEVWERVTECDDLVMPGQDERCRGPCDPDMDPPCKYDPLLGGESCPFNELKECFKYHQRDSFEKDYLNLSWADGICNNNWKVSDGTRGDGYNASGGEYLCQAACNGDASGRCEFPVNCIKISDYNRSIPLNDVPWDEVNSPENNGSFLPTMDTIYGSPYSLSNPPPINFWNGDRINTNVPPPNVSLFNYSERTWCDGNCFSYDSDRITWESSPTKSSAEKDDRTDLCTARLYEPYRVDPLPNVDDTITFTAVNLDESPWWCQACELDHLNQSTTWIEFGETFSEGTLGADSCCGDDRYEWQVICQSDSGADCGGVSDSFCCDEETDCVYDSKCYQTIGTDDAILNTNANWTGDLGDYELCDHGTWHDPDESSVYCGKGINLDTGGYDNYWDDDGSDEGTDDYNGIINDGFCCGDDPDEYNITNSEIEGDEACCDNSTDCVYEDTCYIKDTVLDSFESASCAIGSYYCDSSDAYGGLWNDNGDTSIAACTCIEDDPLCVGGGCWQIHETAEFEKKCCGDDGSEFYRVCDDTQDSSDGANCGADTNSCCDVSSSCIDVNGGCRPTGDCYPFDNGGGSHYSYCEGGGWKDPDDVQAYCTESGCSAQTYEWFDDATEPNAKCCGDDAGETWGRISETDDASCCCNANVIYSGEFCNDNTMWCIDGVYTNEVWSESGDLTVKTSLEPSCDSYGATNSACSKSTADPPPAEGICVNDGAGVSCDQGDEVCENPGGYYNYDCDICDTGDPCDTSVVTGTYIALFEAIGICVSGGDCDTDETCEYGGTHYEGCSSSDCHKTLGDFSTCDNYGGSTYLADGVCTVGGGCTLAAVTPLVYADSTDGNNLKEGCSQSTEANINFCDSDIGSPEVGFGPDGICTDADCTLSGTVYKDNAGNIVVGCTFGTGQVCDSELSDTGTFTPDGTCRLDGTCGQCTSNSECGVGYFCNQSQQCAPQLTVLGDYCGPDIVAYDIAAEGDGACANGQCDWDTGLDDDYHCYTCYDTYFDSQENTYCEADFCGAEENCDEREVGLICEDGVHRGGCDSGCTYASGDDLCEGDCGAEFAGCDERTQGYYTFEPGTVWCCTLTGSGNDAYCSDATGCNFCDQEYIDSNDDDDVDTCGCNPNVLGKSCDDDKNGTIDVGETDVCKMGYYCG